MPYNIPSILLPLIGGYLVISKSILLRHRYKRISSQRLIFDSIIAGVFLFAITYLIRLFFFHISPNLFNLISGIINSFHYHSCLLGTSSFSFIFAIFFTYPINYILKKYFKGLRFAVFVSSINSLGDELERLFLESLTNSKITQITLKNNKVYVGFIIEVNEPQKTNYIIIIPLISGYRDQKTKKLKFTTPYENVVNYYSEKQNNFPLNNFKIIIKQDEILTANFFYPEVYDKFQEHMEEEK